MWGFPFPFLNRKTKTAMTYIDVSHHQGNINWNDVVKNDPKIEGVFIKATQGVGYVDPAMKFNASEAKKAGLKIGYYHYATLNSSNIVTDARQEALFFIDTVRKAAAFDLPLVLDIEENKADLSKFDVLTWIRTFFLELENLGHKEYVLYSYTPFLNSNLPDNHELDNIRLWIAAYVKKDKPVLPKGWNEYWLWQYTAKGRINGIKGDVDMNKTA